jgi:NAD(P)-dependent dehydrogenase (short-subunit alcohol dehydrogenase family)
MSCQFKDKVVLVTGAARGQGPVVTVDDLQETVNLVEKNGQHVYAEQGGVRDMPRLQVATHRGVAELRRLDFALADDGLAPVFGERSHEWRRRWTQSTLCSTVCTPPSRRHRHR